MCKCLRVAFIENTEIFVAEIYGCLFDWGIEAHNKSTWPKNTHILELFGQLNHSKSLICPLKPSRWTLTHLVYYLCNIGLLALINNCLFVFFNPNKNRQALLAASIVQFLITTIKTTLRWLKINSPLHSPAIINAMKRTAGVKTHSNSDHQYGSWSLRKEMFQE